MRNFPVDQQGAEIVAVAQVAQHPITPPAYILDKPAMGPSTSNTLGSPIKVRPSSIIRRWPPDNCPAGWRPFSFSIGKRS
jgi:hypothetical protein